MERKVKWIVIALLLLLPCFPVGRFIFVHVKQGYDQGERESATRPANPIQQHSTVAESPRIDFDTLDFSHNSTDMTNHTEWYVENLPPLNGGGRNGFRDGRIGQGKFEVYGGVESIFGASRNSIPSVSHIGGLVTIELTAERGNVRTYLSGLNGHSISGYVFVDVSPGHPGRVTGYLDNQSDSGTPEQSFVMEARGGDAGGITYRIYRR